MRARAPRRRTETQTERHAPGPYQLQHWALLTLMKLFGHRGASCACPGNTAAAFRNALSGDSGAHPKVTGVECDMQLLRDGTIVVLHDDTLRRTADHAINAPPAALLAPVVNELSWDELRDDVGAWKDAKWAGERMLPVGDFFDLIARNPGAAALVELKGGDQAMVEPASQLRNWP